MLLVRSQMLNNRRVTSFNLDVRSAWIAQAISVLQRIKHDGVCYNKTAFAGSDFSLFHPKVCSRSKPNDEKRESVLSLEKSLIGVDVSHVNFLSFETGLM